jgi:hypothetical protein
MSFLGCYHFTGEPQELLTAYDRLRARYPDPTLDLHVCVVRPDGITVIDTCPDRKAFTTFSTGSDFNAALAGVGLPVPQVEPLGDVYSAVPAGLRP